eukprot:7088-Heterococcus_DN1.PRE.1
MPCIANTMLSGSVASAIDQSAAAAPATPISLDSVPLSTDHAQGEPMHMCVTNAGTTIAQRLVNSGDATEASRLSRRDRKPCGFSAAAGASVVSLLSVLRSLLLMPSPGSSGLNSYPDVSDFEFDLLQVLEPCVTVLHGLLRIAAVRALRPAPALEAFSMQRRSSSSAGLSGDAQPPIKCGTE